MTNIESLFPSTLFRFPDTHSGDSPGIACVYTPHSLPFDPILLYPILFLLASALVLRVHCLVSVVPAWTSKSTPTRGC
ncbi:hypothetical protein P152DRAFT_462719 [Eremomyces bilateralis CBS 781.70]|uniref:Uncharacterized protein n=1 Tax=Eremomyces bilateralis CBS 781.70 TaxID=1392243 RepID=A0A6G1FRC3_9PEZI|nr:uncharacterized protein P152DRAFT_462719 [Eremomyces bilateralis CBS 781.70]KAF1808231.1 hypothetical protein P152DRAFT_462719 [Eremomyces bilateralis CBS 781.70]